MNGSGNRQNIWSIKLHDFLANLVGRVIFRRKPFTHIKSKKSPNFSLSWICNRFMLKSPTITPWDIFLENLSTTGENSSINEMQYGERYSLFHWTYTYFCAIFRCYHMISSCRSQRHSYKYFNDFIATGAIVWLSQCRQTKHNNMGKIDRLAFGDVYVSYWLWFVYSIPCKEIILQS